MRLIAFLPLLALCACTTPVPPSATAQPNSPAAVTPDQRTVTKADYEKIQSGMTLAEVEQLLGRPGEEINSNEIGGFKTQGFIWKNQDFSNLTLVIQNGAVTSKAQTNLK